MPAVINHFSITKNDSILDLGCGAGKVVNELRMQQYNAYGCDFCDMHGRSDFTSEQKEQSRGLLRAIEVAPYRLPFNDNEFDYVISSEVFEHVMDYDSTLKEIHRVLKPSGININTFPGKYVFIEPHVFVPLASIIKNKLWLYFWALLGIRNQFQSNKPAREVMMLNYCYLHECVNYLSEKQIKTHTHIFSETRFARNIF